MAPTPLSYEYAHVGADRDAFGWDLGSREAKLEIGWGQAVRRGSCK